MRGLHGYGAKTQIPLCGTVIGCRLRQLAFASGETQRRAFPKALPKYAKCRRALGNALLCVSSSAIRQSEAKSTQSWSLFPHSKHPFGFPASKFAHFHPYYNPAEPCFSSKFLRKRGWYSINCSRQGLGQGSRRGYPREVGVSFCIRVHLRGLPYGRPVLFFLFGRGSAALGKSASTAVKSILGDYPSQFIPNTRQRN